MNRRWDEQEHGDRRYRENSEYRRDDERGRSDRDRYDHYSDGGRRDDERRESSGNAGRGNNDYRGHDRYLMPGERRGDDRDRGMRYDYDNRRSQDDERSDRERSDVRGRDYRSGDGRSGESRGERFDERRTRGYDPGQGSDYHESGLRNFDYTDYRSRDRYDRSSDRDTSHDRFDREHSDDRDRRDRDDRGRSDLSRRDRRDEGRSDLQRSDGRTSRNHDISGTWRQFNAWGHEYHGDQRGQGIGYHRHDSFHNDFWSQDEGQRD